MQLRAVIWRAASERMPNTDNNSLGTHVNYNSNPKNKIKYKAAFKCIPEHITAVAVKD